MLRISDFNRILEILKNNSRTPFVKIANKIGKSEAAVRKTVRKLVSAGVIRKFTLEIDYKKLGLNVDAIIGIDATPQSYMNLIEALKGFDEIESLYTSTGDHMIIARCLFENSDKLAVFLKKIEKLSGVIKICPAIILEKVK
ncbi:MAG: Lrp/AsnC family transcriptional regulator [Candidatus Odinarchaeum yellowstonii]|uniref:Lrp/AsnC family transcriptional regulator n=1 Tax=Odinarchaeota yellowstonii (strain LCB_4) TaxID=1841599 RepID=A0AAF0D198_ODILC|nr:MAG: Lrp/AsnC family transcriptional regulator [Candidatus Odinarchaeum yellowstonii]